MGAIKICTECSARFLNVPWLGYRIEGFCSDRCKQDHDDRIFLTDSRILGGGLGWSELMGEGGSNPFSGGER